MNQKSQTRQTGAAKAIKDIRRATRKQYSAEEKICIVLDVLRGEETIAELCRRETDQVLPWFLPGKYIRIILSLWERRQKFQGRGSKKNNLCPGL